MQRLFDKTFWKMLVSFCLVLIVALAGIFFTNYFGKTRGASTATLEIVK